MQEHAIAIARVSAGTQREEDQRPGLTKYAEAQGYELDAMIPINGKSAFHGKQVKHVLAAVDKHVKNGPATVVIFREVDRSSRQGVFEGYKLITQIMDMGARVEFSAEAQRFLNTQPELLGIYFKMAQAESETKRERKLQGIARKQESGELNGRIPWGYDAVFDAAGKIRINIVPNALGRKWIPVIFQSAADGKSLRSIQTMLTGIPSPQGNGAWNEASIRRLIANPTYYGGRVGKGNMKYEALVTSELWQQANEAVKARTRIGRGTTTREPTLLKPLCGACYGLEREGAPNGKSPMYRKSRFGHDYYRCSGSGTARKSCGTKLIPVELLDAAIDAAMAKRAEPRYIESWVGGNGNAAKLEEINKEIMVATRDQRYAELAELSAKAAEIVSQSHSVKKAHKVKRPSGMTVGEHWATLDLAGKRDELVKWEVVAYPDGKVEIKTPWQEVPEDFDPENPPIPQW
jgi:DNA invertase Pin-like site-specific DNA recombinase